MTSYYVEDMLRGVIYTGDTIVDALYNMAADIIYRDSLEDYGFTASTNLEYLCTHLILNLHFRYKKIGDIACKY